MANLDIPNACTISSGEPLGTTSLEAASCNLSHLDRVANSTDDRSTNRLGVSQLTVQGLASGFGFIIVGEFATGFTIESRNQVGQATDGTIWRYTGTLPFTVPAGTVPSSPTYEQLVETDHNELTNRNSSGAHDAGAISGALRTFATVSDMIQNTTGVPFVAGQRLNVQGESDEVASYIVSTDGDILLTGGLFAKFLEASTKRNRVDATGFDSNVGTIIDPPPSFPINLDYDVIKTASGFTTNFNFEAQRGDYSRFYIDYENGDDANSGTYNSPLKTISAGLGKTGNVDLVLFPSLHRFDSLPSSSITKSFNMVSLDRNNKARVTNTESATWSKTAGQTNVYQATFTNSPLNWSFDAFGARGYGVYKRLTQVASIADVDSTQGSIFISGNIAYVHTVNSRAADNEVMIHVDVEMLSVSGMATAYLENVLFEGGLNGGFKSVGVDGQHETYAVGCGFNYSQGGEGGVKAEGFGKFYSRDCVSVGNNQDGFNYKFDGTTSTGTFLEDNCIGSRNGIPTGSTNDQGSTAHDGICGVRVGGCYIDNAASGIGDITAGTETWNVGCWAGSNFTNVSASNVPIVAFTGSKVYLDYCQSHSGRFSVFADTGAQIVVRGGWFDKPAQAGAGSIISRDDAERGVFQGCLGDYYVAKNLFVTEQISGKGSTLTDDTTWFQTFDRRANSIINQLAGFGVSGADASNNTMVFGNAASAFMTLGISPANEDNLTITGTYSPFTGVHYFKSKSKIESGLAVDLVNAIYGSVPGYEYYGEIALCNTPESKICAGIVETSQFISGVWINAVAAVGDNRTSKLKGFKVSQPVNAGDILVTDTEGLLKVAKETTGLSVVKFKAMESQSDISKPVYGYFL